MPGIFAVIAVALTLGLVPLSAVTLENLRGLTESGFEENLGQVKQDILFLTRRQGQRIEFRQAALTVVWKSGDRLQWFFPAGPGRPTAAGEDPDPRRSHYYRGSDQAVPNVRHFRKLRYKQLAENAELLFYDSGNLLEYDLILPPGAKPAAFRMRLVGHSELAAEPDGSLTIRIGNRTVRQRKPVAYQIVAGVRTEVACRFAPGQDSVGFETGPYDPRLPLIIDPVLEFSTYLGGNGEDVITSVASDSAGNIYVGGFTASAASQPFPVNANAMDPAYGGGYDAFLTKLNSTGSQILFSTYLGGSGWDGINTLLLDAAGNIYAGGTTRSRAFPTTPNAYSQTASETGVGFLLKMSPDGSQLLYSTLLPAGLQTFELDAAGNAYIVANTYLSDLPTTPGAYAARSAGDRDVYLCKLNSSGTALIYATYFGGASSDEALALTIDPTGAAIFGGRTRSGDLPKTSGVLGPPAGDAFLAKLTPQGTALTFSTYFGGAGRDEITGIVLDANGNLVLTGSTESPDLPVTANALSGYSANGDPFLIVLSGDAANLVYGTYLGGTWIDSAAGVRVDSAGNIIVVGTTSSPSFPVTQDALLPEPLWHTNAPFLLIVDPAWKLKYSTLFYAPGSTTATGLTLVRDQAVAIVGFTRSPHFPVSPNAVQPSYVEAGMWDGFVSVISLRDTCPFKVTPGAIAAPVGGATVDLSISGPAGCNWAGATASDWITTEPASPSVAKVTVAPNVNPARTANLYIAGHTIPVSQPDGCTFSIEPKVYDLPHYRTSSDVRPVTGTLCSWNMTSPVDWIRIENADVPSLGHAQRFFSVAPNYSSEPRSANLTVAGQQVTVRQKGSPCSYALAQPLVTAPFRYSYVSFTLLTQEGCPWELEPEVDWIYPTQGSGGGPFSFSVGQNFSESPRVGTVRIAGLPFLINQRGIADGNPPDVTGFSPRVQQGTEQVFELEVSDVDEDLGIVNLLFNTGLDGVGACYLAFDSEANVLYLVDDAGASLSTLPFNSQTGSVSNSQCTVFRQGSHVQGSRGALRLSLKIRFSAAFTGNKVIYAAARDSKHGNSGWKPVGTFQVGELSGTPRVLEITRQQAGGHWDYEVRYQGHPGEGFRTVQLLLNSSLDGARACYVGVDVLNNVVYLVNNTGTGLLEGIVPGTLQSQNHSQCSIHARQTSLQVQGDILTLRLRVTSGLFLAGPRIAYAGVQTTTGRNSGWQALFASGDPRLP